MGMMSAKLNLHVLHDSIKELPPKLSKQLYKGQCGRVGVFGGSLE